MRYKTAILAAELKKELKTAYPTTKFSVRSESYSMGSSINVSYTDGVNKKSVETIANKFRSVSYCSVSGEILSGGNRFIFVNRTISQDIQNKEFAQFKTNFAKDTDEDFLQREFYDYINYKDL